MTEETAPAVAEIEYRIPPDNKATWTGWGTTADYHIADDLVIVIVHGEDAVYTKVVSREALISLKITRRDGEQSA